MYEDANLYSENSSDHQKEAKRMLDIYGPYLSRGRDETVLDIGCGSADVTYNIIKPHLDPSFKALVGIDMSEQMISYAKNKWPNSSKISYYIADISKPSSLLVLPENLRHFDKIFSFFCLQWIRNRSSIADAIYNLLKPGGEAFLLLVVNSGVYLVWDTVAKSPKWRTYLKSIQLPFNEYIYMDSPDEVFCKAMRSTGLIVKESFIEIRKNIFCTKTDSDEEMICRLRTVDPMISLIPEHLKDDYMNDVLELTKKIVSSRGATDYTALIVILQKPL